MVDEAKAIAAPGGFLPEIAIAFENAAGTSEVVDALHPLPAYTPGGLLTAVAAFSRPADTAPYISGDLVANNTAAGSVVVPVMANVMRGIGEAVRIERVRLRKSGAVLTNAQFRVHLFRLAPTLAVGDNAAFNIAGVLGLADIAGYVGAVDITMDAAATVGASGRGLPLTGSGITTEAAGTAGNETSVWALIEARAAYVPASGETFTLTIEAARS